MQTDLHGRLILKVNELPRLVELILADGSKGLYELLPKADKRGMFLNKVRQHLSRRLRKSNSQQ